MADTFYRGETRPQDLEDLDVDICLQMTVLVHSLTTRQTKLFGNFMDLLFKRIDEINDYNMMKEIKDLSRSYSPNCECGLSPPQKKWRLFHQLFPAFHVLMNRSET